MVKDFVRDRREWISDNRWRLMVVGFFVAGCAGAVLFAKFHRWWFERRFRRD